MFERYTEKARRVIFFARYEASSFGSPYIETEHLLLGLLREDKILVNTFLRSHAAVDSIRKEIEGHITINEKIATSVDLPLSHESKRVLAYGAEEAERSRHKYIGTTHLLAGLLREEKGLAAEILTKRGVHLEKVRQELARSAPEDETRPAGGPVDALKEAIARIPRFFNPPASMQAEAMRQAQARGVSLNDYLISLLEKSLHSTPARLDAGESRQIFEQLRGAIVVEGSPQLDAAELDEEIARRKGQQAVAS